ncbi:MAG: hypothetical protein VR70_07460 [Rhodospirillaceae bacterium BRH_c57]|nr:MAG: hypothetical protein VR70_07460 [Rhodospirillaceae bacterium BRH_c57]
MLPIPARLTGRLALLAALTISGGAAQAHPHVWIDAAVSIAVTDKAKAQSVAVTWMFDEMYSTVAVFGLDTNGDGVTSPAELEPLVGESMVSLQEWNYFLDVRQDGTRLSTGKAMDTSASFEDGRLVYRYTVPLAAPADLSVAPLVVRTFDPSFYIDISFPETASVALGAAPAACAARITEPPPMQETMLGEAALLDNDFSPGSEGIGAQYAQKVTVTCAQP